MSYRRIVVTSLMLMVFGLTFPLFSQQSMVWKDKVGCIQSGDTLQRTGSTFAWGEFHSMNRSVWKRSETNWVEATVLMTNKDYSFGLTYSDVEYNYRYYAHSIFMNGSTMKIYERGDQKTTVNGIAINDKLKIELTNGSINYYHNNSLVYSSTALQMDYWQVATDLNSPGTEVIFQESTNNSLGAYVKVTQDKVSSSGSGSIELETYGGSGSYSWSWKKNGMAITPTTEDLTSITPGVYEVTISDGVNPNYVREIEVFYESEWTELTSGLTNTDGVLTSTGSTQSAVLSEVLPEGEDGVIEIHQLTNTVEFQIGLSPEEELDGCESFRTGMYYHGVYVWEMSGACGVNYGSSYGNHRGMYHKLVREGNELKVYYDNTYKKTITLPNDRHWYIKFTSGSTGGMAYVRTRFGDGMNARPVITHNKPDEFNNDNGSIALTTYGASSPTYSWKKDGVTLSGETASTLSNIGPGEYEVTIIDGSNTQVNTYELKNHLLWRTKAGLSVDSDSRVHTTASGEQSTVAVQYLPAGEDGYIDIYSTDDQSHAGTNSWRIGLSFQSHDRGCGNLGRGVDFGDFYLYRFNGCLQHSAPSGYHRGSHIRLERKNGEIKITRNGSETVATYPQATTGDMYVHLYLDQGTHRTGYIYSSFGHELGANAQITHRDPATGTKASIDLEPMGGTPAYSYSWKQNGTEIATTQDISNIDPGTYDVTITGQNTNITRSFEVGNYMHWEDKVGTESTSTGNIKKSTGVANGMDNGKAMNYYELMPNQEGYFDIYVDQNQRPYYRLGLNHSKMNYSFDNMRCGLDFNQASGAEAKLVRNGRNNAYANMEALSGSVIRVERVGSELRYYLNGQLKQTQDYALTDPVQLFYYAQYEDTESPTIIAHYGHEVGQRADIQHYRPTTGNKGSITAIPFGGDGNYTYVWKKEDDTVITGETSATISNLNPGVYKLIVTDGNSQSHTRSYQIYNHVAWKTLTDASETPEGIIYKSGPTGWNNGWMTSKTYLPAGEDGSIFMRLNQTIITGAIGFSEKPLHQGHKTMSYSFHLMANESLHFYEGGQLLVGNIPANMGDILEIRRTGSMIDYLVNGVSYRTVSVESDKNLYAEAQMYYADFTFVDVFTDFGNEFFLDTDVAYGSGVNDYHSQVNVTAHEGSNNYSFDWNLEGKSAVMDQSQGPQNTLVLSDVVLATLQATDNVSGTSILRTLDLGYEVDWQDNANLSPQPGGGLMKVSGGSTYGTGIGYSKNTLKPESSGYFKFTLYDLYMRLAMGFELKDSPVVDYLDMPYGFWYSGGGKIYIYESGVRKGDQSGYDFMAAATCEIRRSNDTIHYMIEDSVIYSTSVDPTEELKLKVYLQKDEDVNVGQFLYSFDAKFKVSKELVYASGGQSNGEIHLSVTGGTEPYSYQWSTGASTSNITGLPSGTYVVEVTDADAGRFTEAIYLPEAISWQSTTGVNQSPNGDLSKSGSGTATSVSQVVFGSSDNGALQFTALNSVSDLRFGLTTDATVGNLPNMNYSFVLTPGGNVSIYEGGTSVLALGVYKVGDQMTMKKQENRLKYFYNGQEVHSSEYTGGDLYLGIQAESAHSGLMGNWVPKTTFETTEYAKLQRTRSSGGVHQVGSHNVLAFEFEERYHPGVGKKLEYRILNTRYQEVLNGEDGGAPRFGLNQGLNMYQLTCVSDVLEAGKTYLLEVVGMKNRKHYLWFETPTTNCPALESPEAKTINIYNQ